MKKMRRMIPALCMLLVSAIMLSTASYAWFTMNDSVTATGMQVQAKASGSLVVGKAPLGDAAKTSTAVTLETNQQNLTPITWLGANEVDGITTAGWYVGTGVNPITGEADDFESVASEMANGVNYFDQVIYLGSAGDDLVGQKLTVDMGSLVHGAGDIAYNAYAAAIYVYESTDATWGYNTVEGEKVEKVPGYTETPKAVIRVASWNNTSVTYSDDETATVGTLDKNVYTITKMDGNKEVGYTIPSVIGLMNEANYVGLKVVIRVFVDGNLKNMNANKTDWNMVDLYKDTFTEITDEDAVYDPEADADVVYYEKTENGEGTEDDVYTPVNKREWTDETPLTGLYLFAGQEVFGQGVQYCVNSNKVPTTASSLEFNFEVTPVATTPNS